MLHTFEMEQRSLIKRVYVQKKEKKTDRDAAEDDKIIDGVHWRQI